MVRMMARLVGVNEFSTSRVEVVFQTRQVEGVTDQGKMTVETIIINSDRYRDDSLGCGDGFSG